MMPSTDLPTSILFCRLCQSLFRQPRTLPCLHSFCLDCLQHLIPPSTPTPATLSCPLCGQHCPLPPGGVSSLPGNEFLERMCREYVGEVQKTLVSGRSLSPAGSVSASPTAILAGRGPVFQYPPGQGGSVHSSPSHAKTSSALAKAGQGPTPAHGGSPFPLNTHTPPVTWMYPTSSQTPAQFSGPTSPSGVSAGRPHTHTPTAPSAYPTSSQTPPQFSGSSSPSGVLSGRPHTHTPSRRVLSPTHSPTLDYSLRVHNGSVGGGGAGAYGQQVQSGPASPGSGYLSPAMLGSPRHSRSSSSASDAVLQTARRLSSEVLPTRGVGVERRLSVTPPDVVRAWECLQRKLNSLQSAALQVSYSLDTVSLAEAQWQQRKLDLRRDVQRRSAQLQFFIKRQERLLLAALDARKTDESFTAAADQARGELRVNLKALMHETDVIKSVLDLATDGEILSLSGLLLGSKVSQTSVNMTAPELRFLVPEDVSLEEMVGRDFGCLTSTLLTHAIFTPEEIVYVLPQDLEETEEDAFSCDASTVHASTTNGTASEPDDFDKSHDDVAFIDEDDGEEEEMVFEETFEIVDGKMQAVSRKQTPVTTTRSSFSSKTGAAKDWEEARGRGTDVRRTANSSSTTQAGQPARSARTAKDGQLKTETETADSQTEETEQQSTLDRFQNVRESLRQKRRELLFNTSLFQGPGPLSATHLTPREKRVQSLDRSASLREPGRRALSPVTASVTAPVIHTPTSPTQPLPGHEEVPAALVLSDPGPAPTPETSRTSTSPPTSPTERSSRPVRRAVSAASDRASKMEYLRETWRRRKELLMQNEAYFTPAENGKDDTPTTTTTTTTNQDVSGDQNGDHTTNTTTGGAGAKATFKDSIKSRISHLKQALKKSSAKAEEDSSEGKSSETVSSSSAESITSDTTAKDTKAEATSRAQAMAERNVLKTMETILQKKKKKKDLQAETEGLLKQSAISPGPKPSMLVKPCPRDPLPGATPQPAYVTSPLETLQEDAGKGTEAEGRKTGLRVTSPTRGDVSKERLQRQARANIREKKERWRSLSLT